MIAGEVTFAVRRSISELTATELLDLYETVAPEAKAHLRTEIEKRMNKPPQYYNQQQALGQSLAFQNQIGNGGNRQ